jgi:L-lactate dehydrogenase complex protein LldE
LTDSARRVDAWLFATCIVDQFYPEVGESTVAALSRLGVDVDFPAGQTCCGQPAFNSGYWNDALPLAKRTLDVLDRALYVVVPSGSCAAMIRVFYAELLHKHPKLLAKAERLAPRVFELSEFVVDVLGVTDVSKVGAGTSPAAGAKTTYHPACHLTRELGVVAQPRALIGSLSGTDLVEMDQAEVCCGFGGTFSVKYPEISAAMLQDKLDGIRGSGADTVVACDSTCLMQIGGGLSRQQIDVRPVHIAQLLEEATRPESSR